MDHPSRFTITPAATRTDLADVRTLIQAYATWLNLDLSFQGFQSEVNSLPGAYAPPRGRLYMARATSDGKALGSVGVRKLPSGSDSDGEMKRLYVVPEARGQGVGLALAQKAIEGAREAGYACIKLDTLSHMTGAIAMYKRLGFEECQRYYDTPLEGTVFLTLDLTNRGK